MLTHSLGKKKRKLRETNVNKYLHLPRKSTSPENYQNMNLVQKYFHGKTAPILDKQHAKPLAWDKPRQKTTESQQTPSWLLRDTLRKKAIQHKSLKRRPGTFCLHLLGKIIRTPRRKFSICPADMLDCSYLNYIRNPNTLLNKQSSP